jgi:hypothetical protein
LKILDDFLEGVEFKIDFKLNEMNFESTGSKLIDQFGNQKLSKLSCKNQNYSIVKEGN